MRLTVQTDYALRLLIVLAAVPGRRWTLPTLASSYGISLEHLRKITQRLTRLGFVVSTRGRNGGVELAPGGERVSVGRVVRSVEPDLGLVECMRDQNECRVTPVCKLSAVMHRARARFLAELDAVTLAELTTEPDELLEALGLEPRPAG